MERKEERLDERRKRFDSAGAFFDLAGSGWMKLSRDAAIRVIRVLGRNRIKMSMIEAGKWHNPGFEARLDAIVTDNSRNKSGILERAAFDFFEELDDKYDTVIITCWNDK